MPVDIDIVILSFAKDEKLKAITQQGIDTLLDSEDPEKINFNVLVIESNKALHPYQFNGAKTIYPDEEFGFNKYLNIGIKQTHSKFIAFCNNDLLFHKHWASEILKAMDSNSDIMSAAPFCPVTHVRDGYPFDKPYLPIYHIFSGWCFLIKRELINIIGSFDEKYIFWYADIDYLNTLKKHDIRNYMINESKVTHLGSEVSNRLPDKKYKKLTLLPNAYHNYKWRHKSKIYYLLQVFRIQLSIRFFNR